MVVKDEATRMDKKYVFVVFALFVALMMVSGCLGGTKTETIPKSAAFVGGTEGLKISLLNTQQLSLVYENQKFDILVNVENKGEGKLGQVSSGFYGYVALSGINVDSFHTVQFQGIVGDLSPVKKIIGTTQVVPGEQKQVNFSAKAPDIVGAASYPLKVSVLYNYESTAVSSACEKEDVYQQTVSGKESCKIAGSKPVESSGAPIRVTSVDEVPAGKSKLGFTIKVKNAGTGYPFILVAGRTTFPEAENKIDPYQEKDRINITSVKIGDVNATCSPNPLLLINNEGSFYCTADISVSGETVEQLVIKLNYGYVTTATAPLNVQSTGEEAGILTAPITPGEGTGGPM